MQDGLSYLKFSIGFIIGLIFLIKGSDKFIDGAAEIAKKKRVSEHTIGLTLVALATSIPELAVSVLASWNKEGDLALGNVVGSNISNICLVLGVASIIMVLKTSKETFRDAIIMTMVVALLYLLIFFDKKINRYDGIIFLIVYVFFIIHLIKSHKRVEGLKINAEGGYLKDIIFVIVGSAGVLLGAHLLVESSKGIAELLEIKKIIIGLTIVAIGTSLPELSSTISAALKKKHGIAIGNVIGSNIINILLVLGVAGAINPIGAEEKINVTMPFLLLVSILMIAFCKMKLGLKHGILLLVLYGVFLALLFI